MKKHKSKSNITSHQKIKQYTNTITSNLKNTHQHKQTSKTITTTKTNKDPTKDHTNNKILQTKSKSKLQKITSYSSKYDDKNNYQSLINKQRRNSSSIVSHRPISRMSTKRGSVASNKQKPQQMKINEKLKQNDLNYINFQDNQNLENQNIITDLKKSIQNTKSKKKLSLNIHIKPHARAQLEIPKDNQKKEKKNGKIHEFEKKMSKYLNQKDIFSEQFLHQNREEIIKQNKQSKHSSIQKQEEKHHIKNQNTEKQNLLQIYQFYKKTFDINLNNCMKKNTNTTKIEKSKNSSSKSIMKPSNSSAIISHDKCGKVTDYKAQLKQRKNHNQIFTSNKSILNKQKKNELKSKCEKQILLLSQIQKSHLLESRSKSKNSMAHSQSSTKDNIFGCHAEIESSDNIKDASLTLNKIKKKSYKQLIIFNENKVMLTNECKLLMKQTNNQLQINKNNHEEKVNSTKVDENKQYCGKDKNAQTVVDLKNIQIGSSNIDVLNWWSNDKKQQQKLKDQLQIRQKSVYKGHDDFQQQTRYLNQKKDFLNKIQQKNNENQQTQHLQKNQIKIKNIQKQNYYNFGMQIIKSQIVQNIKIKQKQDQILSSLADLSSISVIYDKKSANQLQNSPHYNFKLQIQDIPLDL